MTFRLAFPMLTALAIAACAPARAPTTTPAPAPLPTPRVPLAEAPLNWHLLDPSDGVPGISLLRAERELLAGKQPKRTIIVAVIDGGVDTAHADLRARLWANPRETPGNGRDDDGNGHIDDTRGWNLIGGRDGRNVHHDTFELTRLAAQCADAARRNAMPAEYRGRCPELQAEFARKRNEATQTHAQVLQIDAVLTQITPYLRRATGKDTLTRGNVALIQTSNDTIRQAQQIFLQFWAAGLTPDEIANAKKAYSSRVEYGYNLSYEPRPIVGDDYPDTLVKRYGNHDVTGPDAIHGTHVAGIIGALRDNVGATGVAQSVLIMALRAVPDGDERDKDVALAIRYAVDQGANIINMSFGKAYSPYKAQVDAAIKYADAKGVLMVHGAGNDGQDIDTKPSFPKPTYSDGERAVNWIEVGAASWKSGDSLVANFSNYGKAGVDVFAPGVDIYSTVTNGGYKKESGTSMASPVVAGLAALIMSYYPSLNAADVKRIILESATTMADAMVARPGDGAKVRFGDLSATGGIVNAYYALRLAEQRSGSSP
ncbi:MAG: S8 family peptidase [Gemmatimonadaceae bacterium]